MSYLYADDTYWQILKDFISTVKIVLTSFICCLWRTVIPRPCKSVLNQVILVTGAGNGIGRHLSIEFAKLGAIVVMWDTNKSGLDETRMIVNQNIDHISETDECSTDLKLYDYVCDVGNKLEVYEVGERVRQDVGDVDILINNAAIVTGRPILEIPDERIIETFNVNLLAHFWTVKCFLPAMLHRNRGHVVSIASSCGFAGINKLLDYSSSKFGVMGFSEVLNYENTFSGFSGVRVTTVCPAFVKTGMFRGCSMRLPQITPDLEVTAAVGAMVRGILQEKHVIYIPARIGLVPFVKSMLPFEAWIAITKFLGADKFMDSFQGRA